MPKLHSSRHIIAILKKYGFVLVGQKGSHKKFRHPKNGHIVIVPDPKKEIPVGTFLSIVRQSHLDKGVF